MRPCTYHKGGGEGSQNSYHHYLNLAYCLSSRSTGTEPFKWIWESCYMPPDSTRVPLGAGRAGDGQKLERGLKEEGSVPRHPVGSPVKVTRVLIVNSLGDEGRGESSGLQKSTGLASSLPQPPSTERLCESDGRPGCSPGGGTLWIFFGN